MNISLLTRQAEDSVSRIDDRYRDWRTQGQHVTQKAAIGDQNMASAVSGPGG